MKFVPSLDGLEPRVSPCAVVMPAIAVSDPTVPRPPTNPPVEPPPISPAPPPEPSPGPYPGDDPPIVYPPPPVGGPVGPA